jgi:hypothetical protein
MRSGRPSDGGHKLNKEGLIDTFIKDHPEMNPKPTVEELIQFIENLL